MNIKMFKTLKQIKSLVKLNYYAHSNYLDVIQLDCDDKVPIELSSLQVLTKPECIVTQWTRMVDKTAN